MLVSLLVVAAYGQSPAKLNQRDLQWSCDDANAQACFTLGRRTLESPSPSDKDVADAEQLLRRACLGGAGPACMLQAQRREARLWSESELGRWLVVNAYRVACIAGESAACERTAELTTQLAYTGPPLFGEVSEEYRWKHDANRVLQALAPALWGRCVNKDRAWETRMIATLEVVADGSVRQVQFAAEGSTQNEGLEACVAKELLAARFSSSKSTRYARAFIFFGREIATVMAETPSTSPTSGVPEGASLTTVPEEDGPLGQCRAGSTEACRSAVETVLHEWWTFGLERRQAWVLLDGICQAGDADACRHRDSAAVHDPEFALHPGLNLPWFGISEEGRFDHPQRCHAHVQVDARGRPGRVELFACSAPFTRAITRALRRSKWHPRERGGAAVPFRVAMVVPVRP